MLGGGEGWARSILFNARARDEFAAFFARGDSFALGVCNGCQMMSALARAGAGRRGLAALRQEPLRAVRGAARARARAEEPFALLRRHGGQPIPVVTAHGEGRALFGSGQSPERAIVALQFASARGEPTDRYPENPNGSPLGIAGVTTENGRFTILMPHPERVFRTVQMSWHPPDWGEDSPWMRIFRNARAWLR